MAQGICPDKKTKRREMSEGVEQLANGDLRVWFVEAPWWFDRALVGCCQRLIKRSRLLGGSWTRGWEDPVSDNRGGKEKNVGGSLSKA